MELIKINVEKKRALTLNAPVIVCGNSDYQIEFAFDSDWDDLPVKTVRFVYVRDGKIRYTDIVMDGKIVTAPVMMNVREVFVGVFAGDLTTTTPARIPCDLSIRCGTGGVDEPTPSQYDQIMALLNNGGTPDAVRFTEQALTEEQQAQARENIGAQPVGDYLTSYTETDPTVPEWAKQPNKPSYTASEVGALPNTTKIPSKPEDVGAEAAGTAISKVSEHNTNTEAHNDIRLLIESLANRLNAFFDSDDTTLDELSEIVAYITNNKSLIDSITTSKVSVSDIVNNLTTNVANKPLSAAQGVVLKALIDALSTSKLDASKLTEAVNTALAQAKESGEFDGAPGASVTVSSVSESTTSGGTNTVTFSDGKKLNVKNGKDGDPGVYYGSPEDAPATAMVVVDPEGEGDTVINGVQQTPLFANSIEECTDTSKLYVLPDGYIYGYIYTETFGANYTNVLPALTPLSGLTKNDNGLYFGQYATSSSPFYATDANCMITGQIPCTNASHPSIYIKGVNWDSSSSHSRILIMKNNGTAFTTVNISALATKGYFSLTTLDTDYYRLDVLDALFAAEDSNNVFAAIVLSLDNTTGTEDVIVAYEPIEDTAVSGYQWASTGHAFVPADYEDRIIALENGIVSAEQEIERLKNTETTNSELAPKAVVTNVSALIDKALSREDTRFLRFLISSDAHQNNDNALITKGNKELGQAYGEILNLIGVDFVANLGDSAWAAYGNTTEDVKEQIKQFNKFVSPHIKGEQILNCEGNHDDAVYSTIDNDGDGTTSSVEKFSLAETFSLIYAKNKNVVYDSAHYLDGYCYKDFGHLKVRVICLNTEQGTGDGGVVEDYQLTWLEEVALDMTDKPDWSVITLAHHPFSYGTTSLNAVVEVIDAFINSGGNYVGHFHGHAHAFSVVKMQKNANGIYADINAWEICVPNACYTRNNQYLGNVSERLSRYSTATTYSKTDEDGNRTAFNLVTVCLTEKKIYADNYGAGIDRVIAY